MSGIYCNHSSKRICDACERDLFKNEKEVFRARAEAAEKALVNANLTIEEIGKQRRLAWDADEERIKKAEAERDANARGCDRFAAQRDRLASDALSTLSAAGIATPEKGYVVEPECLRADIEKLSTERDQAQAAAAALQAKLDRLRQ